MQSIGAYPKNGGHTAPHGAGIGPDASEFETVACDPAATAGDRQGREDPDLKERTVTLDQFRNAVRSVGGVSGSGYQQFWLKASEAAPILEAPATPHKPSQ